MSVEAASGPVVGPVTCVVDVTGRVPIEGAHHIAAWVFPPAAVLDAPPS